MRILLLKPMQDVRNYAAAPPLGILYLSAYLKRRLGREVDVLAVDERTWRFRGRDLSALVRDFAPDVVGLSALSFEAGRAAWWAGFARGLGPSTRVVLGGPHATAFWDVVLAAGDADYCVIGEGEETFAELVETLAGGGDPHGVSGLALLEDGKAVATGAREPIRDLDGLPFPDWGSADIEAYSRIPNMNNLQARDLYMTLFTSRSCPFGCINCHRIFGKGFRSHSRERVIEEMSVLVERHGVREFQIVDDVFNLHRRRSDGIMTGIVDRGLDVSIAFPNGLRGDRMDESSLRLYREAGCYVIAFAVETVTERLQRALRKKLDLDRVAAAVEDAFRLGMIPKGFFMIGFPTETMEEIRATLGWAFGSRLLMAGFFSVVPFPRTELHDWYRRYLPDLEVDPRTCFYYADSPPYGRLTGIDLRAVQRRAYRRFYLSPWRMYHLARRAPRRRALARSATAFAQVAFSR